MHWLLTVSFFRNLNCRIFRVNHVYCPTYYDYGWLYRNYVKIARVGDLQRYHDNVAIEV